MSSIFAPLAEYSIDMETDFSQIGLSKSQLDTFFFDFEPTTFVCKCFWMPRYVFDEMGLEKYKTPPPPPRKTSLAWRSRPCLADNPGTPGDQGTLGLLPPGGGYDPWDLTFRGTLGIKAEDLPPFLIQTIQASRSKNSRPPPPVAPNSNRWRVWT